MHRNKLPCYSAPSFLHTYHLPLLVSFDYEIRGDWALHLEVARAVLDPSFVTRWRGRRRSCTSPRLDRRKHLDSCRGLAERVAATQCGTICGHKRNIWLFELCLLLKQLLRIFWIRKIKSHRLGGSVPQAELWCAVWRDIDSLMEPRSHWALRDLT